MILSHLSGVAAKLGGEQAQHFPMAAVCVLAHVCLCVFLCDGGGPRRPEIRGLAGKNPTRSASIFHIT